MLSPRYRGLVSNCFRCREYSVSGRRNPVAETGRLAPDGIADNIQSWNDPVFDLLVPFRPSVHDLHLVSGDEVVNDELLQLELATDL